MRRTVREVFHGEMVTEGAGVRLRRMFGYFEVPLFDPFLMLDDFRSDEPAHFLKGFPWHPHRGIETITYVLKGDVEHGDSLGNQGVISSGDVQWMTAGSGVIHQEMPKGDANGSMHGFQLWANLPASHKMMPPRYRGLAATQIPVAELPGGTRIRVIAGSVAGVRGPVEEIVTDPEYLDCELPPGARYVHPTRRGFTAIVFAIGGAGETDGASLRDKTLALYGDGDELALQAGPEGLRCLLLTGRPLGEPVAWRGPIVMNSEAELDTAFREFREGRFIK